MPVQRPQQFESSPKRTCLKIWPWTLPPWWGFSARVLQHHEEDVDLELREPLAVDLGFEQHAEQVVARFGAPFRVNDGEAKTEFLARARDGLVALSRFIASQVTTYGTLAKEIGLRVQ